MDRTVPKSQATTWRGGAGARCHRRCGQHGDTDTRYFGAKKLIAVGRDGVRLQQLDAGVKVSLDANADVALRAQFDEGVDVVLDFVWGDPAVRVLKAATKDRGARAGEPRLRYVQVGTAAGDEIPVRGETCCAAPAWCCWTVASVAWLSDSIAGAGELLVAAAVAGFTAPFTTLPLHSVVDAWTGEPNVRYVLTPGL